MSRLKKIDVYVNGKYVYSTTWCRTCKEAVAELRNRRTVKVASVPDYVVDVKPEDKVTAHFSKR